MKKLEDYNKEEIIKVKEAFLSKNAKEISKYIRSFDESCKDFLYRVFSVSDDSKYKPKNKIVGSDGATEILSIEIWPEALKKWEPEKSKFTTFLIGCVKRYRIIPYSAERAWSNSTYRIYKEARKLVYKMTGTDMTSSDVLEYLRKEGILKDAVSSAYKGGHSESFLNQRMRWFIQEAYNMNNASTDDPSFYESVKADNDSSDNLEFDIVKAAELLKNANNKFKREKAYLIATIILLRSLKLFPDDKFLEEVSISGLDYFSKASDWILKYKYKNGRFPLEKEIGLEFGLKPNAISNLMKRFKDFYRENVNS